MERIAGGKRLITVADVYRAFQCGDIDHAFAMRVVGLKGFAELIYWMKESGFHLPEYEEQE